MEIEIVTGSETEDRPEAMLLRRRMTFIVVFRNETLISSPSLKESCSRRERERQQLQCLSSAFNTEREREEFREKDTFSFGLSLSKRPDVPQSFFGQGRYQSQSFQRHSYMGLGSVTADLLPK